MYQMVHVRRRRPRGGRDGTAGDRADGDDDADPAAVYALLADGATWPDGRRSAPSSSSSPVTGRPKVSAPCGCSRRAVTAAASGWSSGVAGRALRLRARSRPCAARLQGRGHAARRPGGGTTITWRSTFRAKVPGTGGIYRRQLGTFIGQTVEGLAAAVARAPLPERLSPVARVLGGRALRGAVLGALEADVGQPQLGERLERARVRPPRAARVARRGGRPGRLWRGGPRRARRGLGEVDGGQLEEPVGSGWPPRPRPACWPAGPAWRRPRPGPPRRSGLVTSVSPPGG